MKKTVLAVLLMLGLMFTQQAWAVLTLDFNMDAIHPGTASISYAGGATPLVGSDISVDNITNLGGGPSITHALSGGTLSFTTAAFTGSDPGDWYFAPGGSITLIGGIPDLGIASGTTLLTGSFTGTPRVIFLGGESKIVGATFNDVKDQTLAAYYGLNANGYGYGWGGGINLSFNAPGAPGSSFSSSAVLSGDVTNTPKVPEPATTGLLGLGLIGFVGRVIRSKKKA